MSGYSHLGELAAYLDAFEGDPDVMNVGLVAGENLRRPRALHGLAATPSSNQPITWFAASKVQEAIRAKKNLSLKEVNGRIVTALGVPQTVGGKALKPGDQFYYDPGTKQVLAIRPLAQTNAEAARAATPTPKPAPSASTYAVSKLQELLRAVGSPASAKLKDGKWGPTSKGEWERAARALGMDASSSGAVGATQASVSVATYNALEQRARAVALGVQKPLFGAAAPTPAKGSRSPAGPTPVAPKPSASAGKPTQPSKAGLAKASVAAIQALEIKLGAKIAQDGLFGPATKKAWAQSATKRKLDPTFDRAGPNEAWIAPATLQALTAAATSAKAPAPIKPKTVAKTPAAKSTDPSKSGMTKVNVGQVQDIVRALGSTIKRDGLFGPATTAAWKTAATRRKLDGAFDRAGPIEAWVVPATFKELSAQVGDKKAEPKTTPISAKTPPAPVVPKPGGAAPSTLEPITAGQLGDILKAFGMKAEKGTLQLTWAVLAKKFALDGNSMLTAKGLEVVPKTRDRLLKEAHLLLNAANFVATSTASVPVKSFQEALKFANGNATYKGRFANVAITSQWNKATEDAFFIYFNIPAANIPYWEKALPSLVSSDKKTVKLPPTFAASVASDAAKYAQTSVLIAKKEAEAKAVSTKSKAAASALFARIDALVGKATTLVPVFTLQQALSELREEQKEGRLPGPVLPGISLTGVWDASTNQALLKSFGDKLWGPDDPGTAWGTLVNRLLVKTASSGVSGLFGVFGDLAQDPQANHINLPPDVAKRVQSLAADFVSRSTDKGAMTESKEPVAPVVIPSGATKTVAGGPILIQGQLPQPAPAPAPVTGEQIQVPSIETPEGERVDFAPAPPAPVPYIAPPPPPPVYVPMPSQEPLPIPQEGGDTSQSVTGPTINIQAPAPAESGTDWGMVSLAAAAGIAAAFLLFSGEREHRAARGNPRRPGDRM